MGITYSDAGLSSHISKIEIIISTAELLGEQNVLWKLEYYTQLRYQ